MPKNKLHKLGLGTVQFGLDYGVSNISGKTSPPQAHKILQYACSHNVTTIDTAHLYGNSEEVIGEFNNREHLNIITKTIQIKKEQVEGSDLKALEDAFSLSLERLKKSSIDGLMLHSCDDLKSDGGTSLYKIIKSQKEKGVVSKIGVSVYDSEQIDFLLEHFDIDLIQLPLNIFDQRLIHSEALKRLKNKNVEIHVRSAFLQGLVFMDPKNLPKKIQHAKPTLEQFQAIIWELQITPIEAALAFVMNVDEVDKVICGVNTLDQLQDLIRTASALPDLKNNVFDSIATNDTSIVNPANWS